MDFTTIGTVSSYVKELTMQKKWQMKKETGNFQIDAEKSQVKDWFDKERENHVDKELEMIRAKLEKGKKLTPAEMSYLEKEDPETYKKAKAIEAEKKVFEEELKRCRTKDDVERVKFARTAASLSKINSVKNDPHIPDSAKLAVAMEENMKAMARDKIMEKFVASGRYRELPTDAEKLAAEKALKEADEAERSEKTEKFEKTEKAGLIKKEKNIETPKTEKIKTEDASSDISVKNDVQTVGNEKPNKSETEQRTDVKKLKNSKKRYIECSENTVPGMMYLSSEQKTISEQQNKIDIKA